jgi:hypothetical protein
MENGARLEQWTWPWTPSTSWCVRIIVIRTERSNEQKRKMNDAPCPPLTSHGASINGDCCVAARPAGPGDAHGDAGAGADVRGRAAGEAVPPAIVNLAPRFHVSLVLAALGEFVRGTQRTHPHTLPSRVHPRFGEKHRRDHECVAARAAHDIS